MGAAAGGPGADPAAMAIALSGARSWSQPVDQPQNLLEQLAWHGDVAGQGMRFGFTVTNTGVLATGSTLTATINWGDGTSQ